VLHVLLHDFSDPAGPLRSARGRPYLAIANRQAEIMMRIASEFGFTPASRSRIATPAKATASLFDFMEERPEEPSSGPA
jgi:phage terminase small subunit